MFKDIRRDYGVRPKPEIASHVIVISRACTLLQVFPYVLLGSGIVMPTILPRQIQCARLIVSIVGVFKTVKDNVIDLDAI